MSRSQSTETIELQEPPILTAPASALTTPRDSTTALHRIATTSARGSFTITRPELTKARSRSVPRVAVLEPSEISKSRTFVIITSVTCITGIASLLSGLITVTLPSIAEDLKLDDSLLLWPASIYALTCGCTLLLLGSISDVVGGRNMYLLGCALQSAFTLACGLSTTGMQLIVFRALGGIAISFCLPSAVSIITNSFEPGKRRNAAFASMGGGQPVGFSIGLTLGGVFADSVGWRWGFYAAAILNTIVLIIGIWGLPKSAAENQSITWNRLKSEIDWVGAIISSSSLAMVSYVFASLTGSASTIGDPSIIAILATSAALVPAFVFWCGRQERLGRPALIPNSLWRNRVFTTICLDVFITWGVFNAMENILTFYFQYVQKLTALQSSLRFLPAPVAGALLNVVMGLLVHRLRADLAIVSASVVSGAAPLIMALSRSNSPYWSAAFPAIFLNPFGADVLFTISNLLITSVFPAQTQGLAGGVFNTVAQIGKSVGLATSAVVAASVTAGSGYENKKDPEALLQGYHAAWWYGFALTAVQILASVWGLRRIGRVGIKQE